jgi:hypothetical protein
MATYKVKVEITESRYATIEVEADNEENVAETVNDYSIEELLGYETDDFTDFDHRILSVEKKGQNMEVLHDN